MSNPHSDHLSQSSNLSSTYPSFVDSTDLQAIASLATSARHRTTSLNTTCTVAAEPKIGAFNVVWFIDFVDGAHWVFRTPIVEWSPTLKKRIESDIIGIQLIQKRTQIPIPKIHDHSVVPDNLVGRPYVLQERVTGNQLDKLWFDPTWFTEERRKTVFRSLVSHMSQLRALEFSSIGSLGYSPETDSYVVLPLLPSYDDLTSGNTATRGPYSTVHTYLTDEISKQLIAAPSTDHKVSLTLLRMFISALPDETLDGPPFVLSMPDFNYQNVFVDDSGNVTGLIDWDGMMVGPRQGGYASYPSWITRDWDPLMYGYSIPEEDAASSEGESSEPEDDGTQDDNEKESHLKVSPSAQLPSRKEMQEDSPSTLQTFREEYLSAFVQVDPVSASYTRNSHIFEALQSAVFAPYLRGHILDRLSRHVFGPEAKTGGELSSWNLEQGILKGDWLKDIEREV